jgi:hypothetical protein
MLVESTATARACTPRLGPSTSSAPSIACCSTRAPRPKNRRGSNRHWMKLQWQVTLTFHTV